MESAARRAAEFHQLSSCAGKNQRVHSQLPVRFRKLKLNGLCVETAGNFLFGSR
jgi:hypothetical protein